MLRLASNGSGMPFTTTSENLPSLSSRRSSQPYQFEVRTLLQPCPGTITARTFMI